MALDGCGIFCKCILFIFNFIFAGIGFVFLGLGLWLRFSASTRGIFEIDMLQSHTFVMAVTILIVLGSVMLIVVSFGDYGACSEKRWALQVFSSLLAILVVAVVVVGVLAHSKMDEVALHMVEFYSSLYTLYLNNGDPVIRVTLTFIHKMLHCCGVTGIPLIELTKHTCPKPDSFWQNIAMPNCPVTIIDFFASKEPWVLGIFLGTGSLLIVALVCAAVLQQQLKKVQQEFTAHYSNVY